MLTLSKGRLEALQETLKMAEVDARRAAAQVGGPGAAQRDTQAKCARRWHRYIARKLMEGEEHDAA